MKKFASITVLCSFHDLLFSPEQSLCLSHNCPLSPTVSHYLPASPPLLGDQVSLCILELAWNSLCRPGRPRTCRHLPDSDGIKGICHHTRLHFLFIPHLFFSHKCSFTQKCFCSPSFLIIHSYAMSHSTTQSLIMVFSSFAYTIALGTYYKWGRALRARMSLIKCSVVMSSFLCVLLRTTFWLFSPSSSQKWNRRQERIDMQS